MTDIIYSFEKLGKWKKLKVRLKLIRIIKETHDEVVSLGLSVQIENGF